MTILDWSVIGAYMFAMLAIGVYYAPDEVMVTCKAGSCAIINQKVFHANYPNHSNSDRRMLAIAYRPAWAGPIAEVNDWPEEQVQGLPPNVRKLFTSLNTRSIDFDLPNRPDHLTGDAPGINPRRSSKVD